MSGLGIVGGVVAAGFAAGMAAGGVAPLIGVPAIAACLVIPLTWRSTVRSEQKHGAKRGAKEHSGLYVIDAQKTEDLEVVVLARDVARRLSDAALAERLRTLCDLVDAWSLQVDRLASDEVARSRHGIRVLRQTCQRMEVGELAMDDTKALEKLHLAIAALSRQLAGQLVHIEQYAVSQPA